MAKAIFQKNQRVWVPSVGAWSTIERVVPVWAQGFDEPVRISYDVGFGRDFQANELVAEEAAQLSFGGNASDNWRLMRARNKWQTSELTSHHPYPGSYPIVVTDLQDWGGWRTPGAEYDRDPYLIERQARLIANAPKLLDIVRELVAMLSDSQNETSAVVRNLAYRAASITAFVDEELPKAGTPFLPQTQATPDQPDRT